MKQGNALQVLYDGKIVGTLAMTANHKAAFQYSEEWLEDGFPISPFSLPLKEQVFVPTKDYFDGLFGVFADSLPDNWGRLLLNRLLRAHKQNPDKLTVLDRLAIVGKSGMGALTYYPEKEINEKYGDVDLDELAEQCQRILNTEYSDKLDELYRLGGTSGGARPKIMTTIDGEEWIIKFPAHVDGENAGKMEYDYSCCAKECGITMSETKLFPSDRPLPQAFRAGGSPGPRMCAASAAAALPAPRFPASSRRTPARRDILPPGNNSDGCSKAAHSACARPSARGF